MHIARKTLEFNGWMSAQKSFPVLHAEMYFQTSTIRGFQCHLSCLITAVSQLLPFKLTRIHLETTLKFNLTTKKSVYYVYLEITNEIFWHYSTVHDNSIDLLMAVIHTSHIGNSMASSTVQISCFPFHHYHHIFQITKTARVFISPY